MLALRVQLDQLVLVDFKVQREQPELRVYKVLRAQLGQPVQPDLLVPLEP